MLVSEMQNLLSYIECSIGAGFRRLVEVTNEWREFIDHFFVTCV